MKRSELLKAREKLKDIDDEYSGDIIDKIDDKLYHRSACNLCSTDNFTADMESIDIENGTKMYICEECMQEIIGYCECGFPIMYEDEFCRYCGKVVEEVE